MICINFSFDILRIYKNVIWLTLIVIVFATACNKQIQSADKSSVKHYFQLECYLIRIINVYGEWRNWTRKARRGALIVNKHRRRIVLVNKCHHQGLRGPMKSVLKNNHFTYQVTYMLMDVLSLIDKIISSIRVFIFQLFSIFEQKFSKISNTHKN